MSKSCNNLCSIDREAFDMHFECGARTGSMCECGFFKPSRTHSEICYHFTEVVPHGSEYPEYKYSMCACVDAQNYSLRSALDLGAYLRRNGGAF